MEGTHTLCSINHEPFLFKQKGCPRNGQPVFSGMKNYAFHLAQGDISIRIGRMAMVIGTIGKADVYFMGVILGMRGHFVNGGFWLHTMSDKKEDQYQDRRAEAPQVLFGKGLLNECKERKPV